MWAIAGDQKRPKCKVNFRKHLIQYTGDDQEEEWVLLEWSERPFFTQKKGPGQCRWRKKKNPGQREAAHDLLNTAVEAGRGQAKAAGGALLPRGWCAPGKGSLFSYPQRI
jgi:hypothetical protein